MMLGRRSAVLVLVIALGVAGCTSSHRSASGGGWLAVAPPQPGAQVLAIESLPGRTLVLGSVPAGGVRAPAAWTTTDAQHWQPVPLKATTFYGGQAELSLVGVAGDQIRVYGLAYGGAHGNPRPSVWAGTAAGLVEYEQVFTMFGGEDAISVNAEAAQAGTALIVGQWDGPGGRYGAAVWTSSDGAHWTRNAEDPALVSAPGEQTAAHGAAAGPGGFVVVGDTMRGGTTSALAWTSPDGRVWRRSSLGYSQAATAAQDGCDAAGCVVIGNTASAQPSLVCWALPPGGGAPVAGPRGPGGGLVEPDQVLVEAKDALAVVAIDGTAHVVQVNRNCGGWKQLTLPVASPDAVLGHVAGQLLLATSEGTTSKLWLRR